MALPLLHSWGRGGPRPAPAPAAAPRLLPTLPPWLLLLLSRAPLLLLPLLLLLLWLMLLLLLLTWPLRLQCLLPGRGNNDAVHCRLERQSPADLSQCDPHRLWLQAPWQAVGGPEQGPGDGVCNAEVPHHRLQPHLLCRHAVMG